MNRFIKQHKYHLFIFFILFIIALISGGYLLTTNLTSKHKNITTLNQIDNKSNNIILNEVKNLSVKTLGKQKDSLTSLRSAQNDNQIPQYSNTSTLEHLNTQTPTTTPIISSCHQNCTNTQIKTPLTAYSLKLKADTTVYDAMITLQQNSDFIFSGTNYSSLGFFVNEINGIKNDTSNNKFWIYYINGQSAKVGISNYKLINNDLIEWKYEESKF